MAPMVVPPKEDADGSKPISVRMPLDMVGEIEQIATDTGRSRNETMVLLLRYALEAHWKDSGRKPKK
jgi:metal-responsive CopG/Arc/MetJ family transcriptional regulator